MNARAVQPATARQEGSGRFIVLVRFLAIVLLFGVFSIPVSCAQAVGPHSMFAPPDGQSLAAAGPHAHHFSLQRGLVASRTWKAPDVSSTFSTSAFTERTSAVAKSAYRVSDLPQSDPFMVATFVIAADTDLVPPQPGSDAPVQTLAQRLTGYSEVPDAPPPR